MANIKSIGGNPIVPEAVEPNSVTDAMLVQTGGVLEEVHDIRTGADGTTYDSAGDAVRGQFSELTDALKDNFQIDLDVQPTLVAGSYVYANDNTIQNADYFSITEPIEVKKGQLVRLTATGYNTAVGMIATCNSDNSERMTVARSIDSTEREYTYSVMEDGFVVCSFDHRYDYTISLAIDYYQLFDDISILGVIEQGTEPLELQRYLTGYYVDNSGTINSAGTAFISQSITLYTGQTLNLTARGYNQVISMISLYDAANDSYRPLVSSIDSTVRTYSYTATQDCVVRCSAIFYASGQNVPYSAEIVTPETRATLTDNIETRLTSIENPLTAIQYPQLFTNIICMGDSLTRGVTGGSDETTHNYPYYFRKLTDAEVTNQSQGGITAQGFWNTFASTFDYTTFDCAVIFLGTNGGLTDTVSTDCHADYTQNADTQTGCYGKIIGRIKATAPSCKIFLVAGPNDYVRRATTMNPAVRALAEFYGVGLIDVENCILSDNGSGESDERWLYRPFDGIHYNDFGYMTLANMFYDSMSAFMSANRSMYSD